MFKGMGSDCEIVEGEVILRMRNKSQAKREKVQIWDTRKKKKENKEK